MGERIEIDIEGRRAEAYLAAPQTSSPMPGVLVCMDAIGLRPRLEEMADEIAAGGHVVLVPNLFHREGGAKDLAPRSDLRAPGGRESFFEGVTPRLERYTPTDAIADARAGVAALRARDDVADGPLGVVGYCMGAAVAVRAACDMPEEIAACGGFHGARLATAGADSPHLSLGSARASFAFCHADQDASMPDESIALLGNTLAKHGLGYRNEVIAGAGHGYTMADTSVYDAEATRHHFRIVHELLAILSD